MGNQEDVCLSAFTSPFNANDTSVPEVVEQCTTNRTIFNSGM
jgi:hypothetical protein